LYGAFATLSFCLHGSTCGLLTKLSFKERNRSFLFFVNICCSSIYLRICGLESSTMYRRFWHSGLLAQSNDFTKQHTRRPVGKCRLENAQPIFICFHCASRESYGIFFSVSWKQAVQNKKRQSKKLLYNRLRSHLENCCDKVIARE